VIGCGGGDNPSGGDNNSGGSNIGGGSVPIGKWMKENLNVETEGSWCYDNDPANCERYGRLYTWEAAKAACLSIGKRLPSRVEWNDLVNALGGSSVAGKKLKSKNGWYNNGNGTDDYGFSALPGGSRNSNGGFHNAGYYGYWWTATESGSDFAYYRGMYDDDDGVDERYYNYKSNGYSVRCLED
jgi:uncharacterized protein (TIGR02145 family)